MFGIYLHDRLYENLPAFMMVMGMIVLFAGGLISPDYLWATTLGGFSLMFAAICAVAQRNRHRDRDFSFRQLFSIQ